jgi:hypothetical protein
MTRVTTTVRKMPLFKPQNLAGTNVELLYPNLEGSWAIRRAGRVRRRANLATGKIHKSGEREIAWLFRYVTRDCQARRGGRAIITRTYLWRGACSAQHAKKKKLSLSKHTIRHLNEQALDRAAGALARQTFTMRGEICCCNSDNICTYTIDGTPTYCAAC